MIQYGIKKEMSKLWNTIIVKEVEKRKIIILHILVCLIIRESISIILLSG